jgi:hypothetical protein
MQLSFSAAIWNFAICKSLSKLAVTFLKTQAPLDGVMAMVDKLEIKHSGNFAECRKIRNTLH